ncbi:MAG: 16S rRNA (cytosine(967)-C(5))-methyltransferase, partial [Pseudomonadota bacterium]|nr:16S rRNA (cytosine(967)-C(5))-methyltransferase [Pseudomonadota bacterium]
RSIAGSTTTTEPVDSESTAATTANNASVAEADPATASVTIISSGGTQLLPTPGGPDGFYYALLRKTC